MIPLNDNILVRELQKDIRVGDNGLLEKYDDTNSFIFAEIISMSPDAFRFFSESLNNYNGDEHDYSIKEIIDEYIIVIRRVAKASFINRGYFISYKDIRGLMPRKEFESL